MSASVMALQIALGLGMVVLAVSVLFMRNLMASAVALSAASLTVFAAQTKEIDAKAKAHVDNALAEIHRHLEEQDRKLNEIVERMQRDGKGKES